MIDPNLSLNKCQFPWAKYIVPALCAVALIPPFMQMRGAYRHQVALAETAKAQAQVMANLRANQQTQDFANQQHRESVTAQPVVLTDYNCSQDPVPTIETLAVRLHKYRPTLPGHKVIQDSQFLNIGTITETGDVSIDLSVCAMTASN